MPSTRSTPFQKCHALQYAVRVTQRATTSSSSAVLFAECLFCVYFGREAKVGAKRSRTENTVYFKAPFRTDKYTQHHSAQHPERWKRYQDADDAEKRSFFEDQLPVKETLHSYFGTKQIEKIFLINAPIVDVIIGEMLWDPDCIDVQTHANMMACFDDVADTTEAIPGGQDVADTTEALPDGQGLDRYRVVIKNTLQFYLGIDYLRVGLSFRQAARVLLSTKERSGLASIGSCTDMTISKSARMACAVELQKVYDLLHRGHSPGTLGGGWMDTNPSRRNGARAQGSYSSNCSRTSSTFCHRRVQGRHIF